MLIEQYRLLSLHSSLYDFFFFFSEWFLNTFQMLKNICIFKELLGAAREEIGRRRRKGFIATMRRALVSVAAAAFVVLSGAGQADKGALRSVRNGVTGVGVPPLRGVGATLLTAGPGAGTQCGGGTGAPTGHGKRLSLYTAAERQD